jgi:hypothetical protein
MKKIVRFEARSGNHGEGLKERLHPGRLKAQAFIALLDQMRGAGESFGAVSPSFHRWNCQVFNVIQVALAGCLGVADTGREKQKRKD